MSFFETEETHHFTFEAFAAHPFYTAINRSLVQQALASLVTRPPDATLMIVDMACGTGLITWLITEELALRGPRHASSPLTHPQTHYGARRRASKR